MDLISINSVVRDFQSRRINTTIEKHPREKKHLISFNEIYQISFSATQQDPVYATLIRSHTRE